MAGHALLRARQELRARVWFPNIAGVILDARADWDELEVLLRASYRVLAPRKLAIQVE